MSATEIEEIEAACAREMDALNYGPSIPRRAAAPLVTRRPRAVKTRMLHAALDRFRRLVRRPDLLRLGWGRWKMRFFVRVHYIVTPRQWRR